MVATRQLDNEAFEELLTRAAQSDPAALAAVNDRFFLRLTRFASARGASDPEAIANQALFDGIRSIDRMRGREEGVFRAYLFRCVVNGVTNEHRLQRLPTVDGDPTVYDRSFAPDPADLILSDSWFQAALDELLPDQQAVIIERFARGSTINQTADRLGKTPSSVSHLQSRGLARIRRYLLTAGILVLAVAAFLVLDTIDSGPNVTVEPADQQDRLLRPADDAPPTTINSSTDSAPSGDEESIAPSDATEPTAIADNTRLDGWTACSVEEEECLLPDLMEVRYGAAGRYATRTMDAGAFDCSNAVFGDPALNTLKTCSYLTDANDVVRFESVHAGKCVDISEPKLADGDELVIFKCAVAVSQHQWSLEQLSDEQFLIRSILSDRCMDVGSGSLDDGDPVMQNTCATDAPHQRWSFEEQGNGTYRVRNAASGKCLEIGDGGLLDGSTLVQRSCLDAHTIQQWTLANVDT